VRQRESYDDNDGGEAEIRADHGAGLLEVKNSKTREAAERNDEVAFVEEGDDNAPHHFVHHFEPVLLHEVDWTHDRDQEQHKHECSKHETEHNVACVDDEESRLVAQLVEVD